MMKERTSGKIFMLMLIVAVFAVLLAGCGEKEAKFGERVKDYKGFKTLKEEKIIVKNNLTLQAFVPNGSISKSTLGGITATHNGVTLSLKMLDANLVKTTGGPKQYLKRLGVTTVVTSTAAEEKRNDIIERSDVTYASKYTITRSLGRYTGTSKTEFIKTIEFEGKTYYAYGYITIYETSVNSDTEELLKEMKKYYGVDIYHDKEKLKERTEYFTKNPPKYKKIFVNKYLVQIPVDWTQDYRVSNAQVKTYGPNGKATDINNLFIGSQYISSSIDNLPSGELEKRMKLHMEKLFADLKMTMKATRPSIHGTKAFTVVMKKGGIEYKGYFIAERNYVLFIYAAGRGKVSSDLNEIVKNAFDNLEYTRQRDNKTNV